MTAEFNVLTEPWIPGIAADGKLREYALLEILGDAHNIARVFDPAPPIQFGLYRLLITFVQTALEIYEVEDLEELLEDDRFDMEAISAYVDRVGRHRFNLFDPTWPFLQAPAADDYKKAPSSVVELFYQLPAGTNVTHFVHMNAKDHAVSPSVAARALTSIAPFMTQGGAGYSPSINGTPPLYVQILGKNLFETLVLNCCVLPILGLSHTTPPAWESELPLEPKVERSCSSIAEGFTWRPRRVRLLPSEGGRCTYSGAESPVLVREMSWGPGHKFGGQEIWRDPNVAYQLDEKRGPIPVRPRENREIWRDYGPLFLLRESGDERKYTRPIIVTQFERLRGDGVISKKQTFQFEVYAMRADQAKVLEWQVERLLFRISVEDNPSASNQVDHALSLAEQVAKALGGALKKQYPRGGGGNSQALNRLILVAQLRFWEHLRSYFDSQYLAELERQSPTDEQARVALLTDWKEALRRIARECFARAAVGVETGAKALVRQVQARDELERSLGRILSQEKQRTNRKEVRT